MASRNLSVEQFKDLMRRLAPAVAKELERAVDESADILVNAQRAAVPVKSGNLRRSIRKEPGKHPLQRIVRAGGPLTTKRVRKGASATYDYALGTEFGTREVTAQPFFWPTYRLTKKGIRNRIARRVKPALQKVVKVE